MEISVTDPITGENHRTNPCRDINYFLPQLIDDVKARMLYIAKERGLDLGKVEEAHHRYALFFANAVRAEIKTPFDAMGQTGFFDLDPTYRALVYEAHCIAYLGAAWAGVRSATMQGECPASILEIKRHASAFLDDYCQKEAGAA